MARTDGTRAFFLSATQLAHVDCGSLLPPFPEGIGIGALCLAPAGVAETGLFQFRTAFHRASLCPPVKLRIPCILSSLRFSALASGVHFSAADKRTSKHMDPQESNHHGIHAVAPPNRRREWRESRRVPVEVSGFDVRGRFFTERTSTQDVSDSGCSFLLNAELTENSAVSVRVIRRRNGIMHDDPPVLFRVVWTRQTHPGWPKWTVAGEKMQPVQLWTVGFPADRDNAAANGPASPDDAPPAA